MERGICGTCKTPVTLIVDPFKRWIHDAQPEVACFVLVPTDVVAV